MKSLKQSYRIEATIDQVWEALTDSDTIDEWGGGPAEIAPDEGTDFSLWGGDIHGTVLEVVPNEKLVQEWYSGKWENPSQVTFNLYDEGDTTRVVLEHKDIPDEEYEKIEQGWDEYYMGPLQNYLEEQE